MLNGSSGPGNLEEPASVGVKVVEDRSAGGKASHDRISDILGKLRRGRVHGGLYERHVVVDEEGELNSITIGCRGVLAPVHHCGGALAL